MDFIRYQDRVCPGTGKEQAVFSCKSMYSRRVIIITAFKTLMTIFKNAFYEEASGVTGDDE